MCSMHGDNEACGIAIFLFNIVDLLRKNHIALLDTSYISANKLNLTCTA
jgi:hypothetical protein